MAKPEAPPKEETPVETKPFTVTLEVPPNDRHAFKRLAESRKMSVGALLSSLVSDAVKAKGPGPNG